MFIGQCIKYPKIALLVFALGFFTAQAQEFTFRANTVGTEQSIHYAGLSKFKELVEERTDGRVRIDIFHSAQLGDQLSGIESMLSATIDIATVDSPITTVDPLLQVLGLPYVFRDREHVASVLEGPVGELIANRLYERGLVVLGFMEGGFRQITNDVRPIYEPEDLRGITLRTPEDRVRVRLFNSLGANASPLPYSELYSALQTGVFDGQENPLIEIQSSRFYEVQRYVSITNHVYTISYLLMSRQVFDGLPKDIQQILLEAGREAAHHTAEVGAQADQEILELAQARGMEVNRANIDAFMEATATLRGEVAAELGEEALELLRMIQEGN
jgi:tripartite ATP-independent transporter DctP family solute receptor